MSLFLGLQVLITCNLFLFRSATAADKKIIQDTFRKSVALIARHALHEFRVESGIIENVHH